MGKLVYKIPAVLAGLVAVVALASWCGCAGEYAPTGENGSWTEPRIDPECWTVDGPVDWYGLIGEGVVTPRPITPTYGEISHGVVMVEGVDETTGLQVIVVIDLGTL